jgi:hypothetical protein
MKTKACKLLGVQSKAKKKMENKRRKLDVGSFVIIDAIKEFSEGVKEIEKMTLVKKPHFSTCLKRLKVSFMVFFIKNSRKRHF